VPYSVHRVPHEAHDRPMRSTALVDTGPLHTKDHVPYLFGTRCIEWNTEGGMLLCSESVAKSHDR